MFVDAGGGIQAIEPEPAHHLPARAWNMAVTLVGTPLRAAPLITGNLVITLDAGAEVEITGESVETGGVTWWPATTSDGKSGWIDRADLRRG